MLMMYFSFLSVDHVGETKSWSEIEKTYSLIGGREIRGEGDERERREKEERRTMRS